MQPELKFLVDSGYEVSVQRFDGKYSFNVTHKNGTTFGVTSMTLEKGFDYLSGQVMLLGGASPSIQPMPDLCSLKEIAKTVDLNLLKHQRDQLLVVRDTCGFVPAECKDAIDGVVYLADAIIDILMDEEENGRKS